MKCQKIQNNTFKQLHACIDLARLLKIHWLLDYATILALD